MYRRFINFLEQHGLTALFRQECSEYLPTRDVDGFILRAMRKKKGALVFQKAFLWHDTINGGEFWQGIQDLWHTEIGYNYKSNI